jgi:hypothetical protein
MFKEERAFAIVAAITIAILLGLISTGSYGAERKSFDQRKAERLAEQRAARRAIERRFEACAYQCRDACASTKLRKAM